MAAALLAAAAGATPAFGPTPRARASAGGTPIKHIVVIFMENHTFDNVLGRFCYNKPGRNCDGAIEGPISTGRVIPLRKSPDIVPGAKHRPNDQYAAMNGRKMDSFDLVKGCEKEGGYDCYTQYHHEQIPAVWKLASDYAISDRTFELSPVSSWGAHLQLASATTSGFTGYNPVRGKQEPWPPNGLDEAPPGWGCDSFLMAEWDDPSTPIEDVSLQPSCIPDRQGKGPHRDSLVKHTPTIMDRIKGAGHTFKIYAPGPHGEPYVHGYGWAMCPSFAQCIYSRQKRHMEGYKVIRKHAQNGRLRDVSFAIPWSPVSQHNGDSMMAGDRWIARLVNDIGNGPDWKSTAIFLTYDDCGCFYDHVPPPRGTGWGPRMPMIIISPYAKTSHTDHHATTFASGILAFIGHTFGLRPLKPGVDGIAYDYSTSFNFDRRPRRFETLPIGDIPKSSLAAIADREPLQRD